MMNWEKQKFNLAFDPPVMYQIVWQICQNWDFKASYFSRIVKLTNTLPFDPRNCDNFSRFKAGLNTPITFIKLNRYSPSNVCTRTSICRFLISLSYHYLSFIWFDLTCFILLSEAYVHMNSWSLIKASNTGLTFCIILYSPVKGILHVFFIPSAVIDRSYDIITL